ncbi:hypothetical protein, conserved [Plasmodium gonderi]|uniref:RAP domain-containing protein n=1 Tax=Plasmodium gonderi TaxID=77519 RepID=A0A1Y1JIP8_PLAGO|nr:hypothetical protein, conserved [Plasmodium gonderi]GAW82379.1 hypothetical protein, conserved [Plasmodium gonderi]
MILKRSRLFFVAFQGRRNFSENKNYINNSYLNYIQGNKQNENDQKKKEEVPHVNEKLHIKNNQHMGNHVENVKDMSSHNTLENKEFNSSANNRTNGKTKFIDDIKLNPFPDVNHTHEQLKNYANIHFEKTTNREFKSDEVQGNSDHQILKKNQKGKEKHQNKNNNSNIRSSYIDDHNSCDHNNYDNVKNSENETSSIVKDKSEHKNKPFKSQVENVKSYKDAYINNDVNEFENLNDVQNNSTKLNNTDEDILNMKDIKHEINNHEHSENISFENKQEFSQEQEFNNNPNDNSEKWTENDEDIPNIFEVDENLSEEEKKEKLNLIKLITEKLAGPLKTNTKDNPINNNVGDQKNNEDSIFADNRPIAIEVDGPSHFYANSNRYTTYTKLKHRILTKLGYNVIHISYIDWRKLRNKSEREEFILKKLKEKNDEFLDDNDRIYYNERMNMIKEDYEKYMKEKKENSS